MSALARSGSAKRGLAPTVIAAHPHLAVPALWVRKTCPQAKIIVMSHGVEVWQPMLSRRREALLRASLVLAPSTDTAQKLVEVQGIPPERIRMLPWPLNPTFLQMANAPTDLPVPRLFPDGRVVLTVGRWAASERYKGLDELIHATAQLHVSIPDFHLVAVGSGDDLPRIRKLAAHLGISPCVRFLEHLSRDEIAACYSHADVFALPSTGEGFGLVFLEAMAFSKPIVAFEAGGTKDLVENGSNGFLLPAHDTAQLAKALELLLLDQSLRTEMGQRGAERVRTKYRFEMFSTALEQLLEDEPHNVLPSV